MIRSDGREGNMNRPILRAALVALALSAQPNTNANELCPKLTGDFKQGGLLWGEVSPDASILFNDKSVPVLPDGSFVIGLGRDAAPGQTLSVDSLPAPLPSVLASIEYRGRGRAAKNSNATTRAA